MPKINNSQTINLGIAKKEATKTPKIKESIAKKKILEY